VPPRKNKTVKSLLLLLLALTTQLMCADHKEKKVF
jgi:hypothetical protein